MSFSGVDNRAIMQTFHSEEIHRWFDDETKLRLKEDNQALEIMRYGSFVASEVEWFPALPRAMDRCRQIIDATEREGRSVHSGRVVLAGRLTGSKGRFDRSWHAPDGGLWGCLIHANTLLPRSTLLLSLAVGMAACETFRQLGLQDAHIRWVNDVLIRGLKVAGFLIESHTGPRWGEQYHLIGFGLNVNNPQFPEELQEIASSALLESGRSFELRSVFLTFAAKLAYNIGLLYFFEAVSPAWAKGQEEGAHPLVERWNHLSDTVGQEVVYGHDVIDRPQYRARVTGIADDGGLIMRLAEGHEIVEYSGEVRYIQGFAK